jgi:repressor LexA
MMKKQTSRRTPMTTRQREIYDFVGEFCAEHGFSPSVADIRDEFGWQSNEAVTGHLHRLAAKGWITWTRNKARTVRIVK